MRVVERIGHLSSYFPGLAGSEPPNLQQLAKRHTLDEMRHDCREPIELCHFVNHHDTRMSQLCGRPRFAEETLAAGIRFNEVAMQRLYRDRPAQFRISCLPYRAERPDSDSLQELERAEQSRLHGDRLVRVFGNRIRIATSRADDQ